MHRPSCSCHSHDSFLTVRGYAENAQRERESLELAGVVASRYLDLVGSVSGLRRDETSLDWPPDKFLEDQAERFHNGS